MFKKCEFCGKEFETMWARCCCSKCAQSIYRREHREQRRLSAAIWRSKNPDSVKTYNKKANDKKRKPPRIPLTDLELQQKAEKHKENVKIYHDNNIEKITIHAEPV